MHGQTAIVLVPRHQAPMTQHSDIVMTTRRADHNDDSPTTTPLTTMMDMMTTMMRMTTLRMPMGPHHKHEEHE